MHFSPLQLNKLPGLPDFPALPPMAAFHSPAAAAAAAAHPHLHGPTPAPHPMFRFPPARLLFPDFHMRYGAPAPPASLSAAPASLLGPAAAVAAAARYVAGSAAVRPFPELKMAARPGRKSRAKEEKLCGVCGDRAFGYNFDAISCESCKAFFRRNALKGLNSFRCSNEGRCVMSVVSRRFCKFCRLHKCFQIGMKREYILSETEKAEKRKNINRNRLVRQLEGRGWLPKDLTPGELDERELLSHEEISAIDEIERAFFASSQGEDEHGSLQKAPRFVLDPKRSLDRPAFEELISLAEVSFRRVIDMAKRISVFKALSQPDQIALLKAGSVELLVLRGVITYRQEKEAGAREAASHEDDDDEEEVIVAEEETGASGLESFVCSAAGGPASAFSTLWRSLLRDLHCDNTQLMLLLVICLFSPDRLPPDSRVRELVEEAQLRYSLLLGKYLSTRFVLREARLLFPLLMGKLVDLRDLSQEFAQHAGLGADAGTGDGGAEAEAEVEAGGGLLDLRKEVAKAPLPATSPGSSSSDSFSGMDEEEK